ncbi:AraC family transcriptional regulator [Cohaesibacter intestini]|uniref:AraC family transcriptional regulator n=1 Tax=Cohaesibacter intestini TaxID=2211145 RepID=UPI000DEB29EE|nr:AraC family transcriptional regulator [Cohaesibacter intestini]
MGWISTLFVHKAIDLAVGDAPASRTVRQALYRLVDVDPDAPSDPRQMVADDRFFDLLEHLAAEFEQGHAIPIKIGASMRCDDYGAFGLAFKSAPDLMGSYRRVERFGKVVTSIANFQVKPMDGILLLSVIPAPSQRLGLAMTNELALAAAWSLTREVSQASFVPLAIHLAREKPTDETAYQTHFQGPVHFAAGHNTLELAITDALRTNRLADQGMAQFFETHLEQELSAFSGQTALESQILDHVGKALSEGAPSLADMADRLGMSRRTLQRRLSAAGLAYQDLVSKARKTLSEQLLRETDYALAEIAFLAGFSDQSTFTRAFKRWHDCTPASFRRGM